jgi:hypothetical protein
MKAMDAKTAFIEAKLSCILKTNKDLAADFKAEDKKPDDLSSGYSSLVSSCNNLEQYPRAWSVRFFNIPLMEEEEKDRTATRDKVYDLAYLPILQGAMESGKIASICT